jgi:hypothetical protein
MLGNYRVAAQLVTSRVVNSDMKVFRKDSKVTITFLEDFSQHELLVRLSDQDRIYQIPSVLDTNFCRQL